MFEQIIISGLARGSIYSLIALGYYITYETTTTLNFALGEFLMMGAMLGFTILVLLGLPFIVAIVVAIIIVGILGIVIERVAIRPLRSFAAIGWILSTVGAGMVLRNFAILIWGGGEQFIPSIFGEKVITIFGAGILPQELFNFLIAMVTMILVLVSLKKSLLGKVLRAVALDKDTAGLMGINVKKMVILSFVLSSALAALAGVLISPVTYASPSMGSLGLKAFGAAIIGGLRNPVGIVIGGLLLGIAEFIFSGLGASWREASSFILIILILVIKPGGLFSKAIAEKV